MSTIKGNFGGSQEPSIDIGKTSSIKCDSCGNETFRQTLMLRKLSALVSPSGHLFQYKSLHVKNVDM
jgi:hypothetical protein